MSYEPIFDEETAGDEADRILLTPRPCEECGTMMDNGMDNLCQDCEDRHDSTDDEDLFRAQMESHNYGHGEY